MRAPPVRREKGEKEKRENSPHPSRLSSGRELHRALCKKLWQGRDKKETLKSSPHREGRGGKNRFSSRPQHQKGDGTQKHSE